MTRRHKFTSKIWHLYTGLVDGFTECPQLEGTHKDCWVQLLALHRATQRIPLCDWNDFPSIYWALEVFVCSILMSVGCREGHEVSLLWRTNQTEPWTPMDIGPGATTVPVWWQIEPGTLMSHPYFHSVPPSLGDEDYGDLWIEHLLRCPPLATSHFNVSLIFLHCIQIPPQLLNLSSLNPRPCTISSLFVSPKSGSEHLQWGNSSSAPVKNIQITSLRWSQFLLVLETNLWKLSRMLRIGLSSGFGLVGWALGFSMDDLCKSTLMKAFQSEEILYWRLCKAV